MDGVSIGGIEILFLLFFLEDFNQHFLLYLRHSIDLLYHPIEDVHDSSYEVSYSGGIVEASLIKGPHKVGLE